MKKTLTTIPLSFRPLHLVLCVFCVALCPLSVFAQDVSSDYKQKMEEAKVAIQQWDVEHTLDTLDQEKLPRIVSGGLMMNANMSNFIITNPAGTASSYMKVGGEIGGFLDFRVTKHFAIQGRLVFTAEQNRFAIDDTRKLLWAFGVDIPVYFLGRVGNLEKGYLQFGAGPFTHFTFASNIADKYSNNLATDVIDPEDPYNQLYVLHDNHSGLSGTIGYEFPIGIQINANYMVSLTDIFSYHKQQPNNNLKAIYPQRVSLGIAYRWK